MTAGADNGHEATRSVWTADEEIGTSAFDEDCSPTRVCRNARDFSFEGMAEDGSDVSAAWRATLEREGKLDRSAESIRDLVLGPTTTE